MATAPTTDVSRLVTPSLHPDNLTAMPEYHEAVVPYLAPAVTVMDAMYQGIQEIYKLKEVADRNGAWTPAQVVLQVSKAADKTQAHLFRKRPVNTVSTTR